MIPRRFGTVTQHRGITDLDERNAANLARWVYLSRIGARCADPRTPAEVTAYQSLEVRARIALHELQHARRFHRRTARVIPLRRAAR